ncbi:hypothetical protein [[Mycobacterium] crassicus]|uniref:Septum formation initiator n=1 Tax=[Mycobacterium] crassicus TaxID=2872309 RepID=A0ABU5XRH8_9MYCO|nr:hypothetical protein [Mycolicibacter sp. MYC098]MEB3023912.1 hypothetical protein [Mycolicibacter sp. MYC098]
MDELRLLWGAFCYMVVAFIGFCLWGPWGIVLLPVLVTAALIVKLKYDEAKLEQLRQGALRARAEADAAVERLRIADEELAAAEEELRAATEEKGRVRDALETRDWFIAGEDVPPN